MRRPGTSGPPVGAYETRPGRPPRPALVELAAAMLIVSGALSAVTSVQVVALLADEGTASAQLALLSLVIGVGSVVLGVLVRYGRAWLVTVNVVAVAGFLEITSGSALGLLFGILDVIVVLILFRERPWFLWSPDAPPTDAEPD